MCPLRSGRIRLHHAARQLNPPGARAPARRTEPTLANHSPRAFASIDQPVDIDGVEHGERRVYRPDLDAFARKSDGAYVARQCGRVPSVAGAPTIELVPLGIGEVSRLTATDEDRCHVQLLEGHRLLRRTEHISDLEQPNVAVHAREVV